MFTGYGGSHYDERYFYDDLTQEVLEKQLIGRRIVRVEDNGLVLDDGTTLYVVPNVGCGGCSCGDWWLTRLAATNNAITAVEMVRESNPEKRYTGDYNWDDRVRIFVYTESDIQATEIVTAEGFEDNGFYGEGIHLYVMGIASKRENEKKQL